MANVIETDLALAIEELRSEVRALSQRLASVETRLGAKAVAPETPAAEAPVPAIPAPEPISEETLFVIAAAVAAFLGERAHIRQIRLIRTTAWAQQGRVSIQASHQLQH